MSKKFKPKVRVLSDEECRRLTETPRSALSTLIELARWRNKSGSSPQQYIPDYLVREAEKVRGY